MDQFVLVVGNPIDGVTLTGPFDDAEAASWWAEHNFPNDTWWVASMACPPPEETL